MQGPRRGVSRCPFKIIIFSGLTIAFQLFVTRELSKDTNLEVYDKMLEVQHNPKFAQYFAPCRAA